MFCACWPDSMAKAADYVRQLASAVEGAAIKPNEESGRRGGNYPFPGCETFYQTQVAVKGGLDRLAMFPGVRTRASSGGPEMFWLIDHHIRRRKVDVRLNTPALRLIRTCDNEVRGVVTGGTTASGGSRLAAASCWHAAGSNGTRR